MTTTAAVPSTAPMTADRISRTMSLDSSVVKGTYRRPRSASKTSSSVLMLVFFAVKSVGMFRSVLTVLEARTVFRKNVSFAQNSEKRFPNSLA